MNIFRDALISMVALCIMFACAAPSRAAREEMSGSIQEMMTPGEFKAAGLSKLSPEELQKLNAWLQGYREVTQKAAEKKATAVAARTKLDLLAAVVIHGVFGYKMQVEGTQEFYVDPVRPR